MPALTLPSFAKINLSLEVLGRRADGYHELRTVFQSLALHDTLTFSRRRGPLAITCSDPDVPTDYRNLVWKAACLLWRAGGRDGDPRGLSVHLHKRIPAEAGLGGGSGNAAVALLALKRLWRMRVPPEPLADIAATVGADVAFFLHGGTALGLGRGERIHPLPDMPRAAVVLVKPPFGISTADAYAWLAAGDDGSRPGTLEGRRSHADAPQTDCPRPGAHRGRARAVPEELLPGEMRFGNALEGPVARRHPEIAAIRDALLDAGASAAHLCGSGSTVFGLFDTPARARAAAVRLAWPRHLVAVTSTIGRAAYSRRLAPVRLPGRRPIV